MTSAALRRRRSAIAAVAILALWGALPALGAPPAASPPSPPPKAPDPNADPSAGAPLAERLWHHRNLGKAFYENPTTQYEAVEELKKALDLAPDSTRDRLNYGLALLKAGKTAEGVAELEKVAQAAPTLPHPWFNLGIALKRDSKYEEAIAKLERMAALVPDEPVTRFNLGTLYKLTGKPEKSLAELETAARLAPGLAGPHYQLYNAYRAAGRAEDAARELQTFRERRAEQEGAAVPEDLEWSRYSELDDEPDAAPEQESPAPAEPVWQAKTLATGIDPGSATLAVLDADGDGRPDLLAASAAGVQLFSAGATRVAPSGLEGLTGVLDVAPGDFDDDGRPDLAVVTAGGASLWRNAGGRFERFPVVLPAGSFRRAVWLDVDHDYDLDLILLGKGAAFVRNPGGGATEGWSDQTTKFPFAAGEALAAVAFHAVSDTQGMDLAVATADHAGILYRDRLGGRYEAEPLPALPAGTAYLEAGDADGDGWVDLLAGAAVLANDRGRSFAAKPAPAPPFALVDPGGSGRPRLVPRDVAALAAADFDGDLRTDLAEVTRKGELRLETNATPGSRRALAVRLAGVKNQKLALGAEVEVKAGSSYRKQTYRGVPLVFGLGARTSVDAVRVTWPNGLIQNETLLPSRPAGEPVPLAAVAAASPAGETITEAPRLSGSCPMIFTWDGDRFAFVTDVLGVAPLGASSGDGRYFPVDHDEHVRIPPGSLVAVDGRYDLRITEELREVTYLDQLRLLAVDHPAGVDVFTNDQFQDPPFPPLRFYAARERIRPIAARESEDGDGAAEDRAGRDVRERLLAVDRRYPDGFARDAAGVARLHRLDLDFGAAAPDGRAFLVLTGWVDWADGSTFLAAAQRPGGGLALPRVLVQDAAGRWVTAIPSMGIPSGKPKAIVVDMTGKWASRSRRVRIETNLCVYWDEIFLAPALEPDLRVTGLAPERAALRFRGFSRPVLDPERKQPEGFDYQSFQPVAMWNPTPGLYTRYGDVGELLSAVDDRFVIFGSGDEIRLAFSAAALPPVPAGWTRDLFLKVDGWAKDADANTAFSQSVEPLPFHAMTSYPYPPGEAYPDDPEHALYRRTYNVRPALRLIAPLRQEVAP